ncbi:MAG: DUF1329 domain-containing protein [Pseudomonadota bacterium]
MKYRSLRVKGRWRGCWLGIVLFICASLSDAGAETPEDVENSFYPYRNEIPRFSGLCSGLTLSSSNIEQFKGILAPELYPQIKDGWFTMKTGETTSFDVHPNYVRATKEELGKVSLGEKLGQINGYVAGRPFSAQPEPSDPRAGEKLAWNFKFGFHFGDCATIFPLYSKYRDMNKNKIERMLTVNYHVLKYKHRVCHAPIPEITPNPSGLFRASYSMVLSPYDVKNTQLLILRSEDDLERDNAWMYMGFQRRVRRLATGQTTDAYLGSDYMIEDFEGYNGRISDMLWTYKATCNLMMPFFNHNDLELDTETHQDDPDGYRVVAFGGKGGCYPDVTWQLRKAYVVEAVPIDSSHPLGKRVLYMDAQTFTIPLAGIYDRSGRLWKVFIIGHSHPDHHLAQNKATGVAVADASSMIDVQANHCTTGQFKGVGDPKLCPVDKFSVQYLRTCGN